MDQTVSSVLSAQDQTSARHIHDKAPAEETPRPTDHTLVLAVENMHCGGCMRSVERTLQECGDVISARANLSQRRVLITTNTPVDADELIDNLSKAGFAASALVDSRDASQKNRLADLSRRLGVSAFAMMNVMLLSVSVWSGADGDMSASVQSLFHWLSALIALPAIAYGGQPFFSSAFTALRHGRVNMDVPISIGVILTAALSLYQTAIHGDQVYFDAAIMLLTFLLLGRLLDQFVRSRAANAASNLLKLRQTTVTVVQPSGGQQKIALTDVKPGQHVLIAAGERISVDGQIVEGQSDVDQSLITGESLPKFVTLNDPVFAGTLCLTGPLVVQVTAPEDQSLLHDIATLLANAEQQRGRYVDLADRAARYYAPLVHTLAAATFIGWLATGMNWQDALPIAISVLIITCPCALALAVPAVQVAASSVLMKSGIILKRPDALERLADCDTIVLDKTGTLTRGQPTLQTPGQYSDEQISAAASLAVCSSHPYSRALVAEAQRRGLTVSPAQNVNEEPGVGLATGTGPDAQRLGAPSSSKPSDVQHKASSTVAYQIGNQTPITFHFEDELRDDAASVLVGLKSQGYSSEVLSGDQNASVAQAVHGLPIDRWCGEQTPAEKVSYLATLKNQHKAVVMIGDGLNDAPSLSAAHASMSPASASHISQVAADIVFQGEKLEPVARTLSIAKQAKSLVLQNFALAIGYNIIFVPLAMLGWVTPLIAAVAMSLSSVSVTLNALRIALFQKRGAI